MRKAATGFEPVNRGFADPRLGPLGYAAASLIISDNREQIKATPEAGPLILSGAEDGIRTRDLLLGKEAFYR